LRPGTVIIGLWVAWALSWLAAAAWSNQTVKRLGMRGEIIHRLPLIAGFILLAVPARGYRGRARRSGVRRLPPARADARAVRPQRLNCG
jgi:hypothetical protein